MMKGAFRRLVLMTVVIQLTVSSCSSPITSLHQDNINAMQTQLQDGIKYNSRIDQRGELPEGSQAIPQAINAALLPDAGSDLHQSSEAERFTVSVNNVPAKHFFMNLVKGTDYSMAVGPGVEGNISVQLKNTTVLAALKTIRKIYGYEYTVEGNAIEVDLPRMNTKIYMVNHLNVSRQGATSTTLSTQGVGSSDSSSSNSGTASGTTGSTSVTTSTDSDFWKSVKATITMLIANVGKVEGDPSVTVNESTGIVVVRATPEALRKVDDYLQKTDAISARQVLIEASFLEVTLDKQYTSGINWEVLGASFVPQGGDVSDTIANNSLVSTATGNIFKLTGTEDNFKTAITLLSTEGQVAVLSNPRVSTLNNQKAVIKVGDDSYYVTNVSTTSSASGSGTVSDSSINLENFFSGIALEVTPQVGVNNNITLHIHPSISKTTEENKKITYNGDNSIPTAKTTIREVDSIVKAKNGQVIIIGGLMESNTSLERSSIPGVNDKINNEKVKSALQTQQDAGVKTELVILLKPIVVGDNTWTNELAKTAKSHFHDNNSV